MKDAQNIEERRWSELIPPHTALTFAAVWDPAEGMIVFSGAHLLDADCGHRAAVHVDDSPRDVSDNQSQALTLDLLTHPSTNRIPVINVTNAESKGPCAWACEGQTDTETVMGSQFLPGWLGPPPGMSTGLNSPAFASSTALSVLVRDAESDHHYPGYQPGWAGGAPFKRLPVRFERSPRSRFEDYVSDEGFFEGRQLPTGSYASLPVFVNLNMRSAFSVTTTSTTNYVEVDFPPDLESRKAFEDDTSSWETVRGVDRAFCLNVPPPERTRRLKKARAEPKPVPLSPARPAEVLARTHYNHVEPSGTPSSPTSSMRRKTSVARAKALLDRLGKCVKHEDEEGWVCVEVKQKVTHKVAHNIV